MQLYSVTFNGYKRLADTWVNLGERVIAIVGPNEAGKSSLLEGLTLLNDDSPIARSALSRGVSIPDAESHEVICARFRLSDTDRALATLPLRSDQGLWLVVAKTVGGKRNYRLDPIVSRDTAPRRAAIAALVVAAQESWYQLWTRTETDDDGSVVDVSPQDLCAETAEALKPTGTLNAESLAGLGLVITWLREALETGKFAKNTDKKRAAKLLEALTSALAIERVTRPNADLIEQLRDLVPSFVEFDEKVRSLRSEYDLAESTQQSDPAFLNLMEMAGLSPVDLLDAFSSGDAGRLRSLMEDSQTRLAGVLREAWKQSDLTVSFDRDATTLKITISSSGHDFFSLDDRSDGLRIFLALRAFLARSSRTVAPILLVDEAENHLHYDAQADLVRMFEIQNEVASVIYTTHSVGCLPQDLGRGIRAVTPEQGLSRSRIENQWTRDSAGLTPLMFAMGAGTVPLAPARYVVIGEGPSDALLLPSLLRDAVGASTLEFQVVAGLSEASNAELNRLQIEAARVAYFVDGDDGGETLRQRLVSIGVPAGKIVAITQASAGMTIEDLVDPSLLATALNQYLSAWPPNQAGLERTDIPDSRRVAALRTWCEARDIPVPSKLRVAEEILRVVEQDGRVPKRVSDASKGALIRRLHERLIAALTPTA